MGCSGARSGEFELIEAYFAPLSAEGSFGLKDDAGLVAVAPGHQLVVTQDAIAAGVHFFPDDPPDSIARKALRVNLSDVAAKGAVPTGFSLGLGLPDDWKEEWVAGFASGLAADCREFALALHGGDTFRAPGGPVVSITAWGGIDPRRYTSRMGARQGDILCVTGTIGEGALGLLARAGDLSGIGDGLRDYLTERYRIPNPPVAFAPVIAEYATAAIDISDGFVGDIAKLAAASGVDCQIRLADVPVSPPAGGREDGTLVAALTGGDDYQIAFTVAGSRFADMEREAGNRGVAVSRLARVETGTGKVVILDAGGAPLSFGRSAYAHFGEASDDGAK